MRFWLPFMLGKRRVSGWFMWDQEGQIRRIEISAPDPRVIEIPHSTIRHPLAVEIAAEYAEHMLETMNRVVRSKQSTVRSYTNGAH